MPITAVDPTGHIKLFAANSIPQGYVACDGTVYSTASKPSLFSVIGNTFNTGGEGVGNFRVPDLRGKWRMGQGQDTLHSLTNRAIGLFVGEENHVITLSELALHTHSGTTDLSADGHTHTGGTNNSSGLSHSHIFGQNTHGDGNNSGHASEHTTYITDTSGGSNVSLLHNHSASLASVSGSHTHTFTSDSGYNLSNVALPVTSGGHNNIAPSLALVMCIKI